MVTFPVDDVTPAAAPLPVRPLAELFPGALAIGGDPTLLMLEPDGVHPLLSAVGHAFAGHRPLVLTPDAVWLTIAAGVAQHVRLHAAELRLLLVRHEGKKRLTVRVDSLPADAAAWAETAEAFALLLAAEIDDPGLFDCDFSTSTDVDRTAGRVVLLDVYAPYFALWLQFVCGIPSVTLTGTVDDWRRIRARADTIAGLGLETWCRSLTPILDEFIKTAAGHPDLAFWRRIYNPKDAYGGSVVTGWIGRFYPYLADARLDVPNALLDLPIGEPRNIPVEPGGGYHGPGIRSTEVPAVLSRVIVNINDRVTGDNRAVALHAGLVGVTQDQDGALRPVAGWHVTLAAYEIEDVIDRIVADHETTPPAEEPDDSILWTGTPDLVALYDRIGSATLFGGAWQLLPAAQRRRLDAGTTDLGLHTLIELADGRFIVSVLDHHTDVVSWAVCAATPAKPHWQLADDPADVPLLGTSLAMLLDAALDSGGDITHVETGRLAVLTAAHGKADAND